MRHLISVSVISIGDEVWSHIGKTDRSTATEVKQYTAVEGGSSKMYECISLSEYQIALSGEELKPLFMPFSNPPDSIETKKVPLHQTAVAVRLLP